MDYKIVQLLLVAVVCSKCLAQQHGEQEVRQGTLPPPIIYKQQYRQEALAKYPPARILSHRQSQNHDGAFKFEYAAENGLAQSEVIAPDGTRNGGYTYIDPHGKTISVKYTAGKDGFRILQGDHIPRDSPNHVAIYQQAYSRPNYNPKDDGSYSSERYEAPQHREQVQLRQYQYQPLITQHQSQQPQPNSTLQPQQSLGIVQYRPAIQQPVYGPIKPAFEVQQPQQRYTSISNEIEDKEESEPQYNDAPGKAYSFGTGYSFQFNG